MAKKNNAPATQAPAANEAAEGTDEAQAQATDAGITEATEAQQPEGVVTTEQDADAPATQDADQANDDQDDDQPQTNPGEYLVVWHIKTGGKWYAPDDTVNLDDDGAAPFLASGAIVPKA